MSLTALAAGVLNALGRFAAAAAAPIILNVVLSAAMILAASIGLRDRPEAAMMLAWAVSVAGFAQLAFLAVAAGRQGMNLRFRRPRLTPQVKRLFALALPGIATAGITQINLFIGTMIASLAEGAVSYLYYADRINQLAARYRRYRHRRGAAAGIVAEAQRRRRAGGDDQPQPLA